MKLDTPEKQWTSNHDELQILAVREKRIPRAGHVVSVNAGVQKRNLDHVLRDSEPFFSRFKYSLGMRAEAGSCMAYRLLEHSRVL